MSKSTKTQPPMERIAISRFKATCLAVLERVHQSGQTLLITKRGKPIAQVLPPPKTELVNESRYGCMEGKIEFLGDITEPLPSSDWNVLK